jgi:hypothetical protein
VGVVNGDTLTVRESAAAAAAAPTAAAQPQGGSAGPGALTGGDFAGGLGFAGLNGVDHLVSGGGNALLQLHALSLRHTCSACGFCLSLCSGGHGYRLPPAVLLHAPPSGGPSSLGRIRGPPSQDDDAALAAALAASLEEAQPSAAAPPPTAAAASAAAAAAAAARAAAAPPPAPRPEAAPATAPHPQPPPALRSAVAHTPAPQPQPRPQQAAAQPAGPSKPPRPAPTSVALPDGCAVARRIIASDNSCLFNAVGYVMEATRSKAQELRRVIARAVSSDPGARQAAGVSALQDIGRRLEALWAGSHLNECAFSPSATRHPQNSHANANVSSHQSPIPQTPSPLFCVHRPRFSLSHLQRGLPGREQPCILLLDPQARQMGRRHRAVNLGDALWARDRGVRHTDQAL